LDYRFRVKTYEQIQQQYFEGSQLQKANSVPLESKNETVAHFFFGDENGVLPASLELRQVDLIYNDYIRVMTIMYEKLKNTYNTFVNRFLSEEQKSQNGIAPEVSRFTLDDELKRREEEKQSSVIMKHGDEDLVEDESTVVKHDESTAEQKVTGNIPMLKNNKNALIRNTKPFSQRLKNGELNIDVNDIHAVANQMIFEINLLAGKTMVL
jgi:hypothetical protein